MSARDQIEEDEPPPKRGEGEGTILRERLAASEPPPALADEESSRRSERLAELSKAEIEEYEVSQQREQWTDQFTAVEEEATRVLRRSAGRAGKFAAEAGRRGQGAALNATILVGQAGWRLISKMESRASAAVRGTVKTLRRRVTRAVRSAKRRPGELTMVILLITALISSIAAFCIIAPKAWRVIRTRGYKTSQALIAAGVGLHERAELMGWARGPLNEPADWVEGVEGRPRRYVLKVVTQPPGATVAVADQSFETPGEVVISKPEEPLHVTVRKKSHRPIERQIKAAEFQPKGDIFTYTFDVRLEKLSAIRSKTKSSGNAPKSKGPTFYLEPMPEFPKE
jgi:hypothetical protein